MVSNGETHSSPARFEPDFRRVFPHWLHKITGVLFGETPEKKRDPNHKNLVSGYVAGPPPYFHLAPFCRRVFGTSWKREKSSLMIGPSYRSICVGGKGLCVLLIPFKDTMQKSGGRWGISYGPSRSWSCRSDKAKNLR